MINVKLVAITKGFGDLEGKSPQDVISYVARVSNPQNQENFDTAPKLLAYCIKNKHWSVFETVSLTLEINTTRAIAAQILRHRSFTFQEFSQRYADVTKLGEIKAPSLRRQDLKNRQNSIDDFPDQEKTILEGLINTHFAQSQLLYEQLLHQGVAKECARFVLPLATPTRIYMTGSVRSFIHWIELREKNGTQREHQLLALEAKDIFKQQFPDIAKALEWL